MEKTTKTRCELCGGAAAVHCAADSAFLCLRCDARVHGANFLASRHRRRRLDLDLNLDLNLNLNPAESSSSSASSASSGSCVSTADSAESTAAASAAAVPASRGMKRKQQQRAEAVLESWAKRVGFAPGAARRRAAKAATRLRAMGRGVAAARVPLRVALAAALWSEIGSASASAAGGGDAALLCRLEATAHVPARLVVTVASWMARSRRPAANATAEEVGEEGWAECS